MKGSLGDSGKAGIMRQGSDEDATALAILDVLRRRDDLVEVNLRQDSDGGYSASACTIGLDLLTVREESAYAAIVALAFLVNPHRRELVAEIVNVPDRDTTDRDTTD
jgi:hypothetical protein